jgi:hypothetical protein
MAVLLMTGFIADHTMVPGNVHPKAIKFDLLF